MRGRFWGFVLLCGIAALFVAFSVQRIHSADFFWQLRTGQWVADHRAVPRHDEFTHTVAGHEWIEIRWLFFFFSYLGFVAGGPALLILAQTVVVGLAGWLVMQPSRRVIATAPAAFIVMLAIVSASGRFIVRPEIVTFLMVALFVVSLDRLRHDDSKRVRWGLPLAQVAWANMHTLFALGPVLAWLFAAGSARSPGRGRLVRSAAWITAACVVNPYGLRGMTFPWLLWKEMHAGSVLGRSIEELRSPFATPSWGFELWAWAALLVLSGLTFVGRRSRIDVPRTVVWGAFAYLSLQSVRNAALFAFVAVWASLRNLDEGPALPRLDSRPVKAALAAAAAAGVYLVVTDRYALSQGQESGFGLDIAPWSYPGPATEFILDHGAKREIWNEMSDGAYLDWKAHDRFPVFIDGRNEVYGEPFIKEYLAIAGGKRDWRSVSDRWRIDTALVDRDRAQPLAELVSSTPGWTLVHIDARDLVYVRDLPEHADLIKAYAIDPHKTWVPRGPEPEERPAGWRRALGAPGRPWYSLGMARSFLLIGSPDNAAAYLARALQAAPDHREARMLLAQIETSRGRNAEASRLLSGLSMTPDEVLRGDELLADLLTLQGRFGEAAAALTRVASSSPRDAAVRRKLARAYLQGRDLPHAQEAYRAALSLAPANASYWAELGHSYALAGDGPKAIEAYTTALRYAPGLFDIEYDVGILLMRANDEAGALEHLHRALAIEPSYRPAREAIARIRPS